MTALFLGIDVGTSGVRACAIDGDERAAFARWLAGLNEPVPAPMRAVT